MFTRLLQIVCTVAFITLSLKAQTIGETGKFSVDSSTPGYTLNKGDGERTVTLEVKFTKKFTSKPDLIFAVNIVDANKECNLRYAVESSFVSAEGFLLKVKTWGDSKINQLSGSWIAVID